MHPRLTVASAVLCAVLIAAGATTPGAATTAAAAQGELETGTESTGRALLGRLTVGPESTLRYDRDALFGDFIDRNGDCQFTRSEVLQAESSRAVTYWGGSRCTAVKTGRWVSWYDDKTYTQSTGLEIDHVVALSEVWDSGAETWTRAKRVRYANDLGFAWTLDAVTGQLNQDKGDLDPAQWLPPKHRCAYARHWVAIKYRWNLSVDPAEKLALSGILTGDCGNLTLLVPTRGK